MIFSSFNFRKQNSKFPLPNDYSFKKFVKKSKIIFSGNQLDYISEEPWLWDKATRQYTYKPDTKIIVDFIGKFENLEHDVNYVKGKLGIKKDFPHDNKTHHKHYREYYDEDSKQMVFDKCQRDIEYFGYKF